MPNPDPFAIPDPFAGDIGRVPILGSMRGSRQRVPEAEFRRPLPAEEAKSMGQQILDSSGLSYVLGSLDKPHQAVTGLLAGHGPAALKHLIPFSDTLGITSPEDHVSGRDLTNLYGITAKGDKGWGAWGAGLAADIATDPLTYATFGAKHALTPLGEAVKGTGALKGLSREAMLKGFEGTESGLAAAGKTAGEIEHLADQGRRIASPAMEAAAGGTIEPGAPLAGLMRVGVPFGPKITLGTGKMAQGVARGLDAAGDFLRYKVPGAKTLGALLDNTRGGNVDELGQRAWGQYALPALDAAKADARGYSYDLLKQLNPLIERYGTQHEAMITQAAHAVAEGAGEHLFPQEVIQDVQGLGQAIRQRNANYLSEARAAGAPLADVADPYAKYVTRHALDVDHRAIQMGGKVGARTFWPTVSGANISRDTLFRGIPGGTARLNDWFKRFAATDAASSAPVIRQELESDLLRRGTQMTPDLATAFDKKAADLSARIESASEKYRTQQLPFYTPNLAGNEAMRGTQHARTIANTQGLLGSLATAAQDMLPGSNLIPLGDALRAFQLQSLGSLKNQPVEGAAANLYRKLAPKGAGMLDQFRPGELGKLKAELGGRWGVTQDDLDRIGKFYTGWTTPEQLKSPLKFMDSITNAFKGLAYPIWPASHVRNAVTAFANNMRHGVGVGDYLDQVQAITGRGTRDLSGIRPSLAGLNPADQIEALRGLQFRGGGVFGGHGMHEDVLSDVPKALLSAGEGRFTPHVPGADRAGPYANLAADAADLALNKGLLGTIKNSTQTAKDALLGMFDKDRTWGQGISENLGIKGVGNVTQDTLPAVAAGRKIGANIEDFFRGADMNALMRKGYTPELAGEEMNKLHFDYDNLTDAEKNYMRRAVPFYTFARRNIPLQLETLATQPGITANTYRPFRQNDPGYIPQYLNSGAAMPLGQEEDGKQQFISKFGLPAEEAFEKLHFKNGLPDVGNTALDFLSNLNPIVKAPLEQLFNIQFQTQRHLSDMKAPQAASALGRLWNDDNPQLVSQIMANSPLTRFFTSADKLMDPRKSLAQKLINLGTGVRVTDVDVDKQRAIETRSKLEQIMAGHPNLSKHVNFYVRPEDQANLTPEEVQLMREYTTLSRAAKAYAKQQRQKIGVEQ